jgi:AcrR family transcriptional regulator
MAERRPRAATEEKRRRLLDATEDIMLRDGYASVSSRTVGSAVGIQAPLVHYYFSTIDDLFVAVLHRRAHRSVEWMTEALASPRPLTAWWEMVSEPRGAALFVELLAAANHRPLLKAEVGTIAREVRRVQMEALGTLLDEYDVDRELFPPALIAAAMHGLARGVVQDLVAGYDTAPEEAIAAMRRLIGHLEQRRDRHRFDTRTAAI